MSTAAISHWPTTIEKTTFSEMRCKSSVQLEVYLTINNRFVGGCEAEKADRERRADVEEDRREHDATGDAGGVEAAAKLDAERKTYIKLSQILEPAWSRRLSTSAKFHALSIRSVKLLDIRTVAEWDKCFCKFSRHKL